MNKILFLLLILGLLFSASRLLAADFMEPAEAARRVAAGTAVLIDVREPVEWTQTGVAVPAHLLPLSDLRGARTRWWTLGAMSRTEATAAE